jgi:hypothetical protein
MFWNMTRGIVLGLTVLLAAHVEAQKPKEFLTGMCPVPDSVAHPDLSALADEPAVKPKLLAARYEFAISKARGIKPHEVSEEMRQFNGDLALAFVVDTAGRVIEGTMAVMSSPDPKMSRWICSAREGFYYSPARDSTGKPVMAAASTSISFKS